jgi:hypothetical protein
MKTIDEETSNRAKAQEAILGGKHVGVRIRKIFLRNKGCSIERLVKIYPRGFYRLQAIG